MADAQLSDGLDVTCAHLEHVLSLPYHRLFAEQPPSSWQLRPSGGTWDDYIDGLRVAYSEEWRCQLRQAALTCQLTSHEVRCDEVVPSCQGASCQLCLTARDPASCLRRLERGSVCLITAAASEAPDIPTALKGGDCGWLLVTGPKGRPPLADVSNNAAGDARKQVTAPAASGSSETAVPCTAWYLPEAVSAGASVRVHVIGSAIAASRVLAALADPMLCAGLRPSLRSCIVRGVPCEDASADVDAVLLDQAPLTPHARGVLDKLDRSQRSAVAKALGYAVRAKGGLALIQGPPGTGKTKATAAFLVLALEVTACRMLHCAPTAVAVIEAARQFLFASPPPSANDDVLLLVDVQNAKELPGCLRRLTLSAKVQSTIDALERVAERLARAVRSAASDTQAIEAEHARNHGGPQQAARQRFAAEVLQCYRCFQKVVVPCRHVPLLEQTRRALEGVEQLAHRVAGEISVAEGDSKSDAVFRELMGAALELRVHIDRCCSGKGALDSTLREHHLQTARVCLCTLSATLSPEVLQQRFDIAVLDEAQQALEPEMLGLFRESVHTLVLAGDMHGLHATLVSKHAAALGLERSLCARLLEHGTPADVLETQYRMHPAVSAFPYSHFYGTRARHHASVERRVMPWYERYGPLRFFTHRRTKAQGRGTVGGSSNAAEAEMVLLFVSSLIADCSSTLPSVGVICSSAAQKGLILSMLPKLPTRFRACIRADLLDGCQAKEFDVIVISLAGAGAAGADQQSQRMNVACTRARSGLYVFGDHETLMRGAANDFVWSQLADHCSKAGTLCAVDADLFSTTAEVRSTQQRFQLLRLQAGSNTWPLRAHAAPSLQSVLRSEDHHRWTVLASGTLQKSLADLTPDDVLTFARLVSELKMGNMKGVHKPYASEGGDIGRLFHASYFVTASKARKTLISTIDICHRMQVISLIALVPQGAVSAEWQKFRQAAERMSTDYLHACAAVGPNRDGAAVRPLKCPEGSAKSIKASDNTAVAVQGDCKLFDVSCDERLTAFARLRPLPYILDDAQQRAVDACGAVVVIGRGGSGKTTVLAKRLFDCFEAALAHARTPPLQLFVSQSRGLVRQVQGEFEGLVQSVEDQDGAACRTQDACCEPVTGESSVLPVGPHNVAFLTLFELILALNHLAPMAKRVGANPDAHASPPAHLAGQIGQLEEDSIVDCERFERVYFPAASDALKRALPAAESVYSEIMHVIKRGGDGSAVMQPEDYVARENDGDVQLTMAVRDELYKFYVKYERERERRGHTDMPVLVERILADLRAVGGPRGVQFDAIYLDEVQDLMPCHWRVVDMLRDEHTHVICTGDQAQAITSGNRFRFSELKAHLYTAGNGRSVTELRLAINYRTHEPVLKLANRVLTVARQLFPSEIDGALDEQCSRLAACSVTSRPCIVRDPAAGLCAIFQHVASLGAEQVILVRTREAQAALKERLASNGWSATILTILDAKGLEWRDAILYDIWSSTGLGSQIRVLLNSCREAPEASRGLPVYDARKHSTLCRFLKELYVAVTRAKDRVIFLENDDVAREVCMRVSHGCLEWASSADAEAFGQVSTPDEWRAKAAQYRDARLYSDAKRAYESAGELADARRMEARLLQQRAETLADSEAADCRRRAAALLEQSADFLEAAELYSAAGRHKHAARLYRKVPGFALAELRCLDKAGRFQELLKAFRMYRAAGALPDIPALLDCFLLDKASHVHPGSSDLLWAFLDEVHNQVRVTTFLRNALARPEHAQQQPSSSKRSVESELLKRYRAQLAAADDTASLLSQLEAYVVDLIDGVPQPYAFLHELLAPHEALFPPDSDLWQHLWCARAVKVHSSTVHLIWPAANQLRKGGLMKLVNAQVRSVFQALPTALPETAACVKDIKKRWESSRHQGDRDVVVGGPLAELVLGAVLCVSFNAWAASPEEAHDVWEELCVKAAACLHPEHCSRVLDVLADVPEWAKGGQVFAGVRLAESVVRSAPALEFEDFRSNDRASLIRTFCRATSTAFDMMLRPDVALGYHTRAAGAVLAPATLRAVQKLDLGCQDPLILSARRQRDRAYADIAMCVWRTQAEASGVALANIQNLSQQLPACERVMVAWLSDEASAQAPSGSRARWAVHSSGSDRFHHFTDKASKAYQSCATELAMLLYFPIGHMQQTLAQRSLEGQRDQCAESDSDEELPEYSSAALEAAVAKLHLLHHLTTLDLYCIRRELRQRAHKALAAARKTASRTGATQRGMLEDAASELVQEYDVVLWQTCGALQQATPDVRGARDPRVYFARLQTERIDAAFRVLGALLDTAPGWSTYDLTALLDFFSTVVVLLLFRRFTSQRGEASAFTLASPVQELITVAQGAESSFAHLEQLARSQQQLVWAGMFSERRQTCTDFIERTSLLAQSK